ncbi:MAG: HPr family phosphocarrier protein [Propionibacteriaceae bacterium]|jgi:phosphocarrier protein|nr:HPr family phosphocarrier protein [Propionibacteriaceae bacterium]
MTSFTYTIQDPYGVHARPAGLLVKALQGFAAEATISVGEKTVNGKKLFALMALGIKQGTEITLSADGPDEAEAVAAGRAVLEANL